MSAQDELKCEGCGPYDPCLPCQIRGDEGAALRTLQITREELATMRAAQEFTRVVCELLGNEGSGMDVSTDVLQDMLTAAGVTP